MTSGPSLRGARLTMAVFLGTSLAVPAAAQTKWAVYKNHKQSPGSVTAAVLGTIGSPWELDSIFPGDAKGAWKKVCWYVANGDIYGQRYSSPQIDSGQVSCDTNCNCTVP